jgi:hypothetical protein
MLYMGRKHRVTFRVANDLAAALRKLPNQTAFVETALRDALGRTCPACRGKGRVSGQLRVSDFRERRLPRIGRHYALQLRQIVRMGRRMCATDLSLSEGRRGALAFRLSRRDEVLCDGRLGDEIQLEG